MNIMKKVAVSKEFFNKSEISNNNLKKCYVIFQIYFKIQKNSYWCIYRCFQLIGCLPNGRTDKAFIIRILLTFFLKMEKFSILRDHAGRNHHSSHTLDSSTQKLNGRLEKIQGWGKPIEYYIEWKCSKFYTPRIRNGEIKMVKYVYIVINNERCPLERQRGGFCPQQYADLIFRQCIAC